MIHTITENRLNKIIIKYLDDKFENVEQLKGVYRDIIFKLPNEKYGILGWDKTGTLHILVELINDISNLFGLDNPDSMEVIGKYVENTYDLKVIHTHQEVILTHFVKLRIPMI